MNHEPTTYSTIDERLDHEIKSALAVDPSPEFLVRVRTRIAAEARTETQLVTWWLAGAMACIAIMVTVMAVLWQRREPADSVATHLVDALPQHLEEPPGLPNASVVVAASPTDVRANNRIRLARPAEPVLISPDEAAGLRQLFDDVNEGRIETSLLPPDTSSGPLRPIDGIRIEPITVDALTPIRQVG